MGAGFHLPVMPLLQLRQALLALSGLACLIPGHRAGAMPRARSCAMLVAACRHGSFRKLMVQRLYVAGPPWRAHTVSNSIKRPMEAISGGRDIKHVFLWCPPTVLASTRRSSCIEQWVLLQ